MRVGVNTLFLVPGDVGGSETYLTETLAAWPAETGDTLVLFTNIENDAPLRDRFAGRPGFEFHRLNFRAARRPVRILREQFELPGAAARAKVDVLWSPGYTAPLRAPCPQVVSILDMQYRSHPGDLTPAAWLATDLLVRAAARRARRLIAISEFSRSEIVRFTAAPAERIDVTPLAADSAFGVQTPPEDLAGMRHRLLRFDEPFLLCVAHTYPHKNVAALVEAFGTLGARRPHRLVLVGTARRGEPEVARVLAGLPQPDRVCRLAAVSRPDLIALYQAADWFVFPSLYEGFGLPVLEAMTAGTPVLAGRVASIPEVGGDDIRYAPGLSAAELSVGLETALAIPADARGDLTARARTRAARFTWADTARRTRASLDRAAPPPPG